MIRFIYDSFRSEWTEQGNHKSSPIMRATVFFFFFLCTFAVVSYIAGFNTPPLFPSFFLSFFFSDEDQLMSEMGGAYINSTSKKKNERGFS